MTDEAKLLLALTFAIIGLALVALLLQSCSDGCRDGELRCRGDRIEYCDSEDNWALDVDCADWVWSETGNSAGLTCCEDGEVWCCEESEE